jgi:hypothetical protein
MWLRVEREDPQNATDLSLSFDALGGKPIFRDER